MDGTLRNLFGLRQITLAPAVLLAIYAMWVLVPSILHPLVWPFPRDTATAHALSSQRNSAKVAAEIGGIRGDLWSDYAISFGDLLYDDRADESALELARTSAVRALHLAPHDSRVWLLLAGLQSRSAALSQAATASLKMSYYTAPNDTVLLLARLRICLKPTLLADPEVQQILRWQLRTVLTNRPDLRPALLEVFKGASSEGRHFIEVAGAEIDPEWAASLTARP